MSRDVLHDLSQLLVSLTILGGGFFFLYMIFFSGVRVDPAMKESLNQTTGAVLTMLGGVSGFWIGTSLSSMRKDAALTRRDGQ